jgi:hypothetical protein
VIEALQMNETYQATAAGVVRREKGNSQSLAGNELLGARKTGWTSEVQSWRFAR